MTTAKKPKSKSAAGERGRALQVAETPPPRTDIVQWHEQAAFHLTLDRAPDASDATIWRTHVYHEESGEEQTQSGILQHDLIHWIRERAGAPHAVQEPPAAGSDAPQPAPATPGQAPAAEPRLDVDELAIEAIEVEDQVGGAALKRLRAQVRFARSAAPATPALPETSQSTIQVLAYPREPGQTIVLGVSRRQLAASEPSYTETLEFDLPPLGEYQTVANVVLEDEGLVGAGLGPTLTVVP